MFLGPPWRCRQLISRTGAWTAGAAPVASPPTGEAGCSALKSGAEHLEPAHNMKPRARDSPRISRQRTRRRRSCRHSVCARLLDLRELGDFYPPSASLRAGARMPGRSSRPGIHRFTNRSHAGQREVMSQNAMSACDFESCAVAEAPGVNARLSPLELKLPSTPISDLIALTSVPQ